MHERYPNGAPIVINGEPATIPAEDVQKMFLLAAEEGARPCELEGETGIYRIGHYILVPENSGK